MGMMGSRGRVIVVAIQLRLPAGVGRCWLKP